MCALYAGIYRVALRLQRAAEARRNRMAASLVTVASTTISRIGFGVSGGSVKRAASQPVTTTTGLPDGNDTSCHPTAVAELHSSSAAEDQMKALSPEQPDSVACRHTTDDEVERGMTGNSMDAHEDCDSETPTVSRRLEIAADGAKPPAEVTPLLERSVDNGRSTSYNSGALVASTSGVDGSRLPASRMTSACRQRWLVVLPGDDDEVDQFGASSAANDGLRQEKITRHSVDVGRPRTRTRTRSSCRSLTHANVTTTAVPSTSSVCSDAFHCESPPRDPAEIVSASDEVKNVGNDVVDVATTGEHLDDTPSDCEHPSWSPQHTHNQSVGFNHIPADKNQLTIDDDHVTVTSLVGKCDELDADSGRAGQTLWAAKHDRQQRKKNEQKKDDAAGAQKSVKILAARWRRTARSPFTANRRFAHLRHWKMQRRSAAAAAATQSPSSSSIDRRQSLVSRVHRCRSAPPSVTDGYDDYVD